MPIIPPVVRKYAKAVTAVAGAALAVANVVAGGGDAVQVIVAVLTVLGVYQVPNAR